jgi:hypothetical protein
MIMASRVSENLATFSSWLVGSFAAILGLLIANINSVSKFVPAESLGSSASLFLVAVGFHVIQRYLAAIVAGSVAAGREAEALPTPESLNFVLVMEEIEKSTLWPARIVMRRLLSKVRNGDFAAAGRLNGRLAQVQGILVLAQMVIVICAGYVLAQALGGASSD